MQICQQYVCGGSEFNIVVGGAVQCKIVGPLCVCDVSALLVVVVAMVVVVGARCGCGFCCCCRADCCGAAAAASTTDGESLRHIDCRGPAVATRLANH